MVIIERAAQGKHMTLEDLRRVVRRADVLGLEDDEPIKAQVSMGGRLRQVEVGDGR